MMKLTFPAATQELQGPCVSREWGRECLTWAVVGALAFWLGRLVFLEHPVGPLPSGFLLVLVNAECLEGTREGRRRRELPSPGCPRAGCINWVSHRAIATQPCLSSSGSEFWSLSPFSPFQACGGDGSPLSQALGSCPEPSLWCLSLHPAHT